MKKTTTRQIKQLIKEEMDNYDKANQIFDKHVDYMFKHLDMMRQIYLSAIKEGRALGVDSEVNESFKRWAGQVLFDVFSLDYKDQV